MSSTIDYKITSMAVTSGRPRPPRLSGRGLLRLGAHELDLVQPDLGPPALLTRRVLPGARVEPALREDRPALVEVLTRELGQLSERDQAVKLGLLFGVACLVLARVGVGRKPHVGDVCPLGRRLDLRIRRQIPDQDHLVDHRTTSVNLWSA